MCPCRDQPGLPPGGSEAEDLLWIREDFFAHPHDLPYTVVFGHTPQREVGFDLPYKIGIDTGLVYGGKLTCLEITEKKLFQIERGSRQVVMTDAKGSWAGARAAR